MNGWIYFEWIKIFRKSSDPTKKRNVFDWWSCWFEQIRRENKILMDTGQIQTWSARGAFEFHCQLSSMLSTRHFSEHWILNNRPCRTVSCTESWIPQRTHSSPREFFRRKIISHFICQLAWCQVQPKMMSRSKHFIDWQKRCFQRQSESLLTWI